MASIRKRGNKSTERRVRLAFVRGGIRRWKMHPKDVFGTPDFWFPKRRVAVFVDGCFWHGCHCSRLPRQNSAYWHPKIAANARRDRIVSARLRSDGIQVLRIWEHDVRDGSKLLPFIARVERACGGAERKKRRAP